MTASECKSYSVECRHTYKDSFLSWDWIADLSKIEAAVRLVDRWDVRDRALEELLGVTAEDVVSSGSRRCPLGPQASTDCYRPLHSTSSRIAKSTT